MCVDIRHFLFLGIFILIASHFVLFCAHVSRAYNVVVQLSSPLPPASHTSIILFSFIVTTLITFALSSSTK